MAFAPVTYIPSPLTNKEALHSPELNRSIAALGEKVAAIAVTLAPVQTGALRASISAQLTEPSHSTIEADVPYAAFVEFGTSLMDAQPFLRPALDSAV